MKEAPLSATIESAGNEITKDCLLININEDISVTTKSIDCVRCCLFHILLI
jgi:hypothetical protein